MTAPGLNWKDRRAFRAFLRDLSTSAEDLVTVAEDQTDKPGKRMYGRAGAREKIDEAKGSIHDLLAYAGRGLTADEARVRVTVFANEVKDGRVRVFMKDAQDLPLDFFVSPEDLDGDRLRVVLAGDPDGEPVPVILPDPERPGSLTNVRRGDVLPAEPEGST